MGESIRIFNIEDFSIDDGPGIRTVVFFKGCSLACKWCHNPESISRVKQVLVYPQKCIGCGACFEACPSGANRMREGEHVIDRGRCIHCMNCVRECFAGALVQAGEDVPVETIIRRVVGNKHYFLESGGGLTASGGECMLQIEGLFELFSVCKQEGIHTAADTCGSLPWESFERMLPVTDLFLYDIKAFHSDVHKACTGEGNERILANFEKLISLGAKLLVRVPFIPGYNDEELPYIAEYLASFPQIQAELLGYHELGNSKYSALGRKPIRARNPKKEELNELKKQYGFQ